MKKVLIYATATQGSQEASAYEEAINQVNDGNEVYFVHCDRTIAGCLTDNPGFHQGRCRICEILQRRRAKKFLPDSVKYITISMYLDKELSERIKQYQPQYNTVEEVKRTKYKEVSIGYGAMSTFISVSRNMNPILDDNNKALLDKLLKQQVVLTELLSKAIDEIKPELVIFHNGRLAQYKPVLCLAEINQIPFITTETLVDSANNFQKNYFECNIPHDVNANLIKYNDFWNKDVRSGEIIGRQYFENKRFGRYTGEIVYTKQQKVGRLPDGWDESKKHIVIFNSSEDEFCAINKMVDEAALFSSQLEGITKIVEFYKKKNDVQLFLRIHPNLKNVKYSYHTKLYDIKSDNFIIIPPTSDVSSYSLMDAADLIIVFGSTMGIESAYWGKPVICLAYALYALLKVVYVPKSEEELYELLNRDNLPPLDNYNCLKYGNYYLSDQHEHFKHIVARKNDHYVLGHHFQTMSYLKLLGSDVLYYYFDKFLGRVYKFDRSRYKNGY